MADDAPEIPDDQQVPDAGQSSAQDLGLGQGSLTPQPVLKPPSATQGYGMPALIGMIGQMIHPTATLQPGQMPRTPSRLDAFENFLGQFTSSLTSGLAASGTGPAANIRGAAAAMGAPHQRALQDYQLQAQEQNRQAILAQQQANLEATRAKAQEVQVQGPDGNTYRMPVDLAAKILPAKFRAQAAQEVESGKEANAVKIQAMKGVQAGSLADKNITARLKIAGMYSQNRLDIAAANQEIARARNGIMADRNNIMGGKVPTPLIKQYTDYQTSVSRLNTMNENLHDGLAGDQQAMLSLLTNHIGMTLGDQKGARITQAIIKEAQDSAPLRQRIEAKFDSRGLLSGVTLTPDQMQQMVNLAKNKMTQEARKFNEIQNYVQTGQTHMLPQPEATPEAAQGGMMFARDPQGKLHQAPIGTPLPKGWKAGR